MGWMSAVAQVVRNALTPGVPIVLEALPEHTFDSAFQPIDQLLMAMRTGDLTRVGRDEALSVAAVQRGRNELCSLATIPLGVYRGLTQIPTPLFKQLNPNMANVVMMSWLIEDLAFEAIAWWRKTAYDQYGFPVFVDRVAPDRVSLIDPATGKPDARWVWITGDEGEAPERVPATDMIRFDSPNPGILKANARAVRIAAALDRLTELYANNPILREWFTDADGTEVEPMREEDVPSFLAEYTAGRQVSPVGWIPGNVKRMEGGVPNASDMALVPLQAQTGTAIANGLGVDPEDIGVSTTSRTYQNEDARRRDKINRMFSPYMRAIGDRLSMGDVTPRGQEVRWDLTDYLKPDPITQTQYWTALEALGVVDAQWIGEKAGVDPAVTARAANAASTAPADAGAGQSSGRPLRVVSAAAAGHRFAGDGPAFVFNALDFSGDPPAAPTVDTESRTITGLAVPYNATANKYGMKYSFLPGSLEYSTPERMAHLMDHQTPVGFHRSVTDTPEGPVVALAVLDGPDGSPAKAQRDQLLYDAAHGLYSGLSVGVDFNLDDPADVEYDEPTDTYLVKRATWRETSSTYMPAFDDARVTTVAASRSGGMPVEPCIHCHQRHAPNISCATFAAHTAPPAQTVAVAAVPAAPEQTPGYGAFQAFMAAQLAQVTEPAPAPPVAVSPHHAVAVVTEPSPYRFDRRGNLRAGSHDFSSDLFSGWKHGDQAARDRAQAFVESQFADRDFGNLAPQQAEQQFAITPANVVNLNYPANRPDLYVDQLDYQYPMYNGTFKGTLDAVTPFVVPKFNSSSGLVADHVTGTEPTPGAFTASAQTITPSAVSGKVEITREAFDQGGNPQMSGLIWRQMVRGWYEALEAFVQAQFVANAASIPDIDLNNGNTTSNTTDSTLDQNVAAAMASLQYIRGGDRYRTVYTQIDLYKALIAAKDTTGRRLYPMLGAMNAVGQADPRYSYLEANGKLWVPAWATAATGTTAASSWMFDPDVVCLWASAPHRIDLQWRVAWVDMGIWGYKAFAITDFTRTRELKYDPVVP